MNIITSRDKHHTPWRPAGNQKGTQEKSMWIVRIALNRPFTFVVAALAFVINPPDELPLTEPAKIHTL
jgi:hypothetical protein